MNWQGSVEPRRCNRADTGTEESAAGGTSPSCATCPTPPSAARRPQWTDAAFLQHKQPCSCLLCLCLWTPANKSKSFALIDWLLVAYIALFSALLSRFTALACDSTGVTSFIARFFFFLFLISTIVVYLQHWQGWCHMKLQPSRLKSCVHHTTLHYVTPCKATYVRCMRV